MAEWPHSVCQCKTAGCLINKLPQCKKEKTSDPAHRVEECYSFWPLKFSAWLNHISSEWYSELFLMISKCNHLKMQHGVT